jgi:predicted nuclease with RNAse H fold
VRLQGLPEVASHHALDAIIAGLTAGMYVAGRFQRVEGPDGAIVLPLPPVP